MGGCKRADVVAENATAALDLRGIWLPLPG